MTIAAEGNWLEECLGLASKARVAIFGDFCLDAYWEMDLEEDEISVETGLPVRRVRKQEYSLGAAANVAANLVDLGVADVHAVGLIGDDLYGGLMQKMLQERGVNTERLLSIQDDWQTSVFGKPYRDDVEQNRIDFGGFNVLKTEAREALSAALSAAAQAVDVVILNQQVISGVSTPEMIEAINGVIAAHSDCIFIVDSRHYADRYRDAVLKINDHEAARLCGHACPPDERITSEQAQHYARELYERSGVAVFVTRGENGIVVADANGLRAVPGIQIVERTDPVGAGDTTVAALAAVLGKGCDSLVAARFAGIAAAVTVRKLQTTGTASPEEIRAVGSDPDYIYLPELADDSGVT